MNEQTLRRALQNGLSGIAFDPARQEAVRSAMEMGQRRQAPRRLTLAVALLAALMLLGGTAVAAGLGLFGRFAGGQDMDASPVQMSRLEEMAIDYNQTQTVTVEGREIHLTLRQAYCDGLRLYYTYEIDGGVGIGDGACLPDGGVADIYESGEMALEDGVTVGYQTVQLPEGTQLGDTLTFMLYVRGEKVPFTIQVGETGGVMTGSGQFERYSATASFRHTGIVLRGSVLLESPEHWEQYAIRNDEPGDGEVIPDHVINYVLTDGVTRWSCTDLALGDNGDGRMKIVLMYDLPEDLTNLSLIPEYGRGGEKPEEAIRLTEEVSE